MFQSTIDVSVTDPPPKTKLVNFFTGASLILYGCVDRILTLAATVAMPLHHLWDQYYPQIAFVEEGVVMPHSTLGFLITLLLVLAEIKAQGEPGFPFKTHPLLVKLSVDSVVMYGLSCSGELVASGLVRASAFAIIARLGKICFLCILVISLAF
ncbi:hypothetical protein HanRHA438_Chr13g0618091 [Helianthus annuus]|uniref:Uncharacterized protein n=1 Tax=Helianthus annuus TaxID=4232 RepID=A0A9K3EL76_HELAN|nr:hypothetical protein HanXRQr2_Chr13g0607851 [Helianthus annuus]KAJ0478269.1 hypothetical protein HanHA300_Chr13g0498321 [Helianthus annuus]KAJ0499153.1 hypothetical protein HanHA89_Chr13g0530991 [Helianthus annuus]KAJ0665167.1 hypothetical protein HanLR1_Chr13g0501021 [Helianthus annuus]KAJ0672583.1 hypothetical protein HanOQP8_Chr13g0498941 [Helianthus annuus]